LLSLLDDVEVLLLPLLLLEDGMERGHGELF
jgi:hypothetical protein